RNARADRGARVARGNRDRRCSLWRCCRLAPRQRIRDLSSLATSLSVRDHAQQGACIFVVRAGTDSRHARSKRAFVARLVAVERGGAKVLFMVEPAGDRGAAAACHDTKDTSMRSTCFYPFVLSLSKDDDRCGSTKPVLSLPKGSPRTVTSNR